MLVTRYLFKNLFNTAVFIALSLTLVIWLTQSLNLLELVANSDAPPSLFLRLVVLTLPKFLEIILPLSLVIAVLFTYNRLIMDNELIVMRACGIDHYALARPAIILAVIISLTVTVLSAWVTPTCVGQVQALRQTVKTQYSAFLLREGVFNTFGDKFTVYLRAREADGSMLGLIIHDTRDKEKPPITIIAKKGQVVMDGDIPNIVVFEGMRQQLDPVSGTLSKLYFSRYTIEIKGLEGTAQERWRGAGERTLSELVNPDSANKRDRDNANLFLAEAFHRLVSPWNALSFTMTALAALLLGPFNRRGQNRRIAFSIFLVAVLQSLNLVFVNLAKKHLGAAPLVALNTLLPILLGFYFLHLAGEQRLMAFLQRWNAYASRRFEKGAA
ncbi:MAG: LptF/LptG family permease [Alphaproteobacteria bacterium]|nr:LptF/LptG family permease [Alphaproteobacteria bacterium]